MGIFTSDLKTLRELYQDELENALDMENQIIGKGLPTMIEHATDPELAGALHSHLEESQFHVARLERILDVMEGEAPDGSCSAMSALISEGSSRMKDTAEPALRDVVLIATANQIEHHEIAVYGTLATWANILGESEAATMLEKTLGEEKNADELLTKLSAQINVEATIG